MVGKKGRKGTQKAIRKGPKHMGGRRAKREEERRIKGVRTSKIKKIRKKMERCEQTR